MPRRLSLIVLLCLPALLAGCGSDDEEAADSTTSTTETQAEEKPAVPDVVLGVKVEDVKVLEGSGSVESGEAALRVSAVEPGSPADEAGIEPSNLILEVDGDPVETTNDLFAALADNEAGEEVEVKIEGRKGPETLTIALAERTRAP